MKPKIFLTGSTGFLGKYLKNTLIKNGYSLVCLCRNNLEDSKDKSTIITATDEDFFSKNFLKKAINKCDAIIHLAALTHIPYCEEYPDFAYSSNVLSTINILSRLPKKCKLIVFSTSSTYAPEDKMHDEDSSDLRPIDFYGITKKHVEIYKEIRFL